MTTKNNKKTIKGVMCKYCGYYWVTESDLILATCPSCNRKTPNNIKKDRHKDDKNVKGNDIE